MQMKGVPYLSNPRNIRERHVSIVQQFRCASTLRIGLYSVHNCEEPVQLEVIWNGVVRVLLASSDPLLGDRVACITKHFFTDIKLYPFFETNFLCKCAPERVNTAMNDLYSIEWCR